MPNLERVIPLRQRVGHASIAADDQMLARGARVTGEDRHRRSSRPVRGSEVARSSHHRRRDMKVVDNDAVVRPQGIQNNFVDRLFQSSGCRVLKRLTKSLIVIFAPPSAP